jgi:GrpB-like predicted nucleotidyltransferase (UPF0157 family)
MSKPLSEMTLKELWELFPIELTEHRACWDGWYLEERDYLISFLPCDVKLSHIGSTAINGIRAKPIVDILAEAAPDEFGAIKASLVRGGYICMAQKENRMDFNKGYTPDGFAEKVFHLHLRQFGDNDEIYFRDYLNKHPDIAKEYEKLKLSLWKPFEHDRDGYTESKTEFVRKYTRKAKEERRRNGI